MTNTIIPALLTELLNAYGSAWGNVRAELNPGLGEKEILAMLQPLKLQPPTSLIQLYQWRNGCDSDNCGFQFRDTVFIPLQEAIALRNSILTDYADAADENFNPAYFLPFSQFENGVFYGLQCTPSGTAPPRSDTVICVSEGIDPYFHSIESMLRTCIDWVREDASNDEDLELEVWRRHNPGVFT